MQLASAGKAQGMLPCIYSAYVDSSKGSTGHKFPGLGTVHSI